MYRSQNTAFTLVELAIVLVIIGLLVGGVLVGQDLIKQAEIKATARQLEQFDTGGAAFRTKYYSIAGDLSSTKATQFGLVPRAGGRGQGDGNGVIENTGTSGALGGLGGETALYWRDLWDGRMIGLEYNLANDQPVDSSAWVAPAADQMRLYMPESKIRSNNFFHIYGANGLTYYHIGTYASGATTGAISWAAGLNPLEDVGIDAKIDDGLPLSGLVIAQTNQNVADTGAPAAVGVCVDTTPATATYSNTTSSYQTAITCQLRVRAQF